MIASLSVGSGDRLQDRRRRGWWWASNAIWDVPDLSIYDIAIYLYLCRCADQNGQSFPSTKIIAAACRISERQVRYSVKHLENVGLLTKERTIREDGGAGQNIYTIHDPESAHTPPAHHAEGGLHTVQGVGAPPATEGLPNGRTTKNNNNRNRAAVAKDSTVNDTERTQSAPPAAAVVVVSPCKSQADPARPPLAEEVTAAAPAAVKAGPSGATAEGGSGLDSAGGGQNQPLRGPGISDDAARVRARYRDITGLDDLRPAFARKLLTRYGTVYVEEKLALLETWLSAKRAAGERVTPLRAFLDALRHDWSTPGVVRRDRANEDVRRTQELLARMEEARREAVPPERAREYLARIRATLRGGPGRDAGSWLLPEGAVEGRGPG